MTTMNRLLSQFRTHRRVAVGFAALATVGVILAVTGGSSSVGAARQVALKPTKGKTLGFVATYFFRATSDSPDDCPKGITTRFDEAAYLATKVPPAEVERLMKKENTKDKTALIMNRGRNGEDVCRAPWAADDPLMPTSQSKIAPGLDLDEGGKNTCGATAQYQYTAPWGEPGIDNAMARVYGCTDGYSEKGFAAHEVVYDMQTGEFTVLVEIGDVDDPKNDDDVTVAVYSGADSTIASAAGDILPHATYWTHPNTYYHNVWKGRIVNGVVTTKDRRDVHLRYSYVHGGPEGEVVRLHNAGLRFEMKDDGTALGFLGGYRDLAEMLDSVNNSQMFYFWTCDQMYHALIKHADGYPDPKTGRCTMISAAWRIRAVPAFIIHPTDEDFAVRAGRGIFQDGGGKNTGVFARGRKGPHDISGNWTVEVLSQTQNVQHVCDIQQGPQKPPVAPGAATDPTKGDAKAAALARFKAPPALSDAEVAAKGDTSAKDVRAACGLAKAGETFVPVRKEGDRVSWDYDVDGTHVQVDATLVSRSTMLGTAKFGSTTASVRVRKDGKGWSLWHRQMLAPVRNMFSLEQ